jgi:hypothetical protein
MNGVKPNPQSKTGNPYLSHSAVLVLGRGGLALANYQFVAVARPLEAR